MRRCALVLVGALLTACNQAAPDERAVPQDRPVEERALADAGAQDLTAFTAGWLGPDGRPAARGTGADRSFEVQASRGPDHCEWQEAVFLSVGWPLGTSPETSEQMRQYIRDDDGVVSGARYLVPFDDATELPDRAAYSGYRTDRAELWFGADRGDEAAYLKLDDRVERWPRAQDVVACA